MVADKVLNRLDTARVVLLVEDDVTIGPAIRDLVISLNPRATVLLADTLARAVTLSGTPGIDVVLSDYEFPADSKSRVLPNASHVHSLFSGNPGIFFAIATSNCRLDDADSHLEHLRLSKFALMGMLGSRAVEKAKLPSIPTPPKAVDMDGILSRPLIVRHRQLPRLAPIRKPPCQFCRH